MKKKVFSFLALLLFYAFTAVQAKDWVILEPTGFSPAYHHAATEFQHFYLAVTGMEIPIANEPVEGNSMVVIGSDAVNHFTRLCIEEGLIKPLALGAGSDAYRLLSASKDGQNYLFLAGGCGRSTMYAVYDFFERQAGCHYFWDGDIVPKQDSIVMTGLDVLETPRFQYRGTRYFAHRSLTRFQAEHWGPKEWEQEIDWMVKKRLNLFMLRIGWDDVFQKAFPDIVSYPPVDRPMPSTVPRSYSDRTTAWPLQYRGELRKHILQYARERELIHPEDMGTMTHWYTPTPQDFMDKVQPKIVSQSNSVHTDNSTLLVWDIRDDKNLENYWKLTQAHIDNYGSPQMFHTIGMAERNFYDYDKGVEFKQYGYRRIITKLREHYPNAPLLISAWDFLLWKDKDVKKMLTQLDPDNTIIMDNASEDPNNDFRKWIPRGKFPYMFGTIHSFERETDIRGNYDVLAERFPSAIEDPMCKGFLFWPETSHADILFTQYFTHNSWKPDMLSPEENVSVLCHERYGSYAEVMKQAWMAVLPFIRLGEEKEMFNIWRDDTWKLAVIDPGDNAYNRYCALLSKFGSFTDNAALFWKTMATLPYGKGNHFVDRDVIDLARAVAGRLLSVEIYQYMLAQRDWKDGKTSIAKVREAGQRSLKMYYYLRDILSLHDDYSLLKTYRQTESVYSPLNPFFEQTLKGNAQNEYCRTYISELFDYYFIPIYERYVSLVDTRLNGKELQNLSINDIVEAFYAKPLQEMISLSSCPRTTAGYSKLIKKLASLY